MIRIRPLENKKCYSLYFVIGLSGHKSCMVKLQQCVGVLAYISLIKIFFSHTVFMTKPIKISANVEIFLRLTVPDI